MKKIIVRESQLRALHESLLDGGNGDIKEYPGSEVTSTSNTIDTNGKVQYGKPKNTDKIQSDIVCQNTWLHNQKPINRV